MKLLASVLLFSSIGPLSFSPKFCEGIRVAETPPVEYGMFIDEHALSLQEATDFNDPIAREAYRQFKSKTWRGQVRSGQIAHCGASTL